MLRLNEHINLPMNTSGYIFRNFVQMSLVILKAFLALLFDGLSGDSANMAKNQTISN